MANERFLSDANRRRQATAAEVTCAQVRRALRVLGADVPEHLAAAGRLRLAHPDVSLRKLGALADPPLSKDALAGRLRRLLAAGRVNA